VQGQGFLLGERVLLGALHTTPCSWASSRTRQHNPRKPTLTSLLLCPSSGRLPCLTPSCHANAHIDGASLPSRARNAAAIAAAAAYHLDPELELSRLGPVHTKLVLLSFIHHGL
jgi:hypothetical protein